ncbi:pentapeptide repeat-containing protein [Blastococcus sp. HT6-30]|uniref:pentapeptide repeat-containing protein n=1 Tax=Blastococcus sp. HT6-30 TaxID=3144843 RepID=UPI00321AD117
MTFRMEDRFIERQEQAEQRRFGQAELLENVRFVRERSQDAAAYKPFDDMRLRGAQLSGLRLGCDRSEPDAFDTCATFARADLRRALLNRADLSGAYLFRADAQEAQAEEAQFIRATLAEADFRSANLRGAFLQLSSASGVLLANADLTRASLLGAHMDGADLRGAVLDETILGDADLRGANLAGVDMTTSDFIGATVQCCGDDVIHPPNLDGVCYDDSTLWPEEHRPVAPPECAAWK